MSDSDNREQCETIVKERRSEHPDYADLPSHLQQELNRYQLDNCEAPNQIHLSSIKQQQKQQSLFDIKDIQNCDIEDFRIDEVHAISNIPTQLNNNNIISLSSPIQTSQVLQRYHQEPSTHSTDTLNKTFPTNNNNIDINEHIEESKLQQECQVDKCGQIISYEKQSLNEEQKVNQQQETEDIQINSNKLFMNQINCQNLCVPQVIGNEKDIDQRCDEIQVNEGNSASIIVEPKIEQDNQGVVNIEQNNDISLPSQENDEFQLQQCQNQIYSLRSRLDFRIQSIRSLNSTIIQKITFKKIWLILYFFPLLIGFSVLLLRNILEYCDLSILIHLVIYTFLCFRNFVFNYYIYKKCKKLSIILRLYDTNVLSHEQFFCILSDLQISYKKCQTLKIQIDKKSQQNKAIQESLNQLNFNYNSAVPQVVEQSEDLILAQLEDQVRDNNNAQEQVHRQMSDVVQVEGNNTENKREESTVIIDAFLNSMFNLIISNLHDSNQLKVLLVNACDLKANKGVFIARQRQMLMKLRLKESDLKEMDVLVDFNQQLVYVVNSNLIQREIENAIKYKDNTAAVKISRVYSFFEEYYFVIYNLMEFTFTFCYPAEINSMIIFSFYYSIVNWVQIVVISFSLIVMLFALIFYLFFQIFVCKRSKKIKTVSFKTAKNKLIQTKKFSEEDLQEVSCIICYDNFVDKDDVFVSVCCKKFYHKICITEWFKKSQNCPLCRTVLPI